MMTFAMEVERMLGNLRLRGFWTLSIAVASIGLLLTAPAFPATLIAGPLSPGSAANPAPGGPVERARQCQQRAGPFVTQSTAYQRLRQAQAQGYGVSGVFPCYGGGGRGYCFNVFYPC